jgi:hypothetical protein
LAGREEGREGGRGGGRGGRKGSGRGRPGEEVDVGIAPLVFVETEEADAMEESVEAGAGGGVETALSCRRVKSVMVTAIPVAKGSTTQSCMRVSPAARTASNASRLVSFTRREEPAAFGCGSMISPDRPIPWPSP